MTLALYPDMVMIVSTIWNEIEVTLVTGHNIATMLKFNPPNFWKPLTTRPAKYVPLFFLK